MSPADPAPASRFRWVIYRAPDAHPRVDAAELALIRSEPPEPATSLPWSSLLLYPQTFAFAVGKFLTDPISWFYLFWVPKFLNKQFGLTLDKLGLPLIVIYLAAGLGSILGGWASSALITRAWTANAARKSTMLVCATAAGMILEYAGRYETLFWIAGSAYLVACS